MDNYQSILITHIVSIAIILLIFIVACIILIIVTKKLGLEKFYYFLAFALILFSLIFAGIHLLNCSLDLYYDSYETYTGMCNSPARDTLILYDEDGTKLISLVSSPSGENNLYVVYSRRSKIALEVKKID